VEVNHTHAVRLGVDFGTTHTVAAVADAAADVRPLLFDASPLLVSAVYSEPGGTRSTGRDAERGALHDPSRFEPNPKLRIDEGRVLLGDAEFDVDELIAAPLRRVAVEAARQLGAPAAATVLTHPAAWAARRRDVLVRAAERAGLGPVMLVPEPVAAATYHAEALGGPLPPGSGLVVYDLGGGTFDVTVVRRTAAGWEGLASAGLDDVGGLDLDASIVDHLGTTVGVREPRRWRRLLAPTDAARPRNTS
jgi:molecular chaperone DnaK (HSP70)